MAKTWDKAKNRSAEISPLRWIGAFAGVRSDYLIAILDYGEISEDVSPGTLGSSPLRRYPRDYHCTFSSAYFIAL